MRPTFSSGYNQYLIQSMNDEKPQESSFKETAQSQHKRTSPQHKNQEPSNNYSFNSYQMNFISGSKGVAGLPVVQPVYQPQNGQYVNYYSQPQMYTQHSQYPSSDVQMLLTNMYQVLNTQSQLLHFLMEKNDRNFQYTNKIYDQVKNIKKQQGQDVESFGPSHFKQVNYNSGITTNDLVSILYGSKASFKFKLIVDSKVPFETPLYRQRNFKLKINLIDQNGKLFANSNRIPISIALYTVQNPPKFLESNTLGNKMLKGYTQQDLVNGICQFEKIQIKEVTSHYPKTMLFLVAFAKVPSLGCVPDDHFVDYTQIRPLVIDRVIVKAKKMKSNTHRRGKQLIVDKDSREESEKVIEGDENS